MSVSSIHAAPDSSIATLRDAVLELQRANWDPGRIERLEDRVKVLAEHLSEVCLRLNVMEKPRGKRILHTSTGPIDIES